MAALVRAAHRPKLKEYIYWFHAKTPEEQEYLRPKLERWIHKQRDGARKKRQAKRCVLRSSSSSFEAGLRIAFPVQEKPVAGAGRRLGHVTRPCEGTGAGAGRRSGLGRVRRALSASLASSLLRLPLTSARLRSQLRPAVLLV